MAAVARRRAPAISTGVGGTGERGGGEGSGRRRMERSVSRTRPDARRRHGEAPGRQVRGDGVGMPGTQLPGCLWKKTRRSRWAGPAGPRLGQQVISFLFFLFNLSFLVFLFSVICLA